jgi:hypothetical protein
MRSINVAPFLLCAAFIGNAHAITGKSYVIAGGEIDLDKPGAMATLARVHPDHYRKVMTEIAKSQTIYVEPMYGIRNALMDDRARGGGILLPSDPAKRRLSAHVGMYEYRVTVEMTKDPATLRRAR